jgi:archaellin
MTARLRDERGMVGKLGILWLLLAALVVIAAIDAGSIILTKVHLSNVATDAASDAVADYSSNKDVTQACTTAATTIHSEDPGIKLGKTFCVVDTTTGAVTIRLHKEAATILAGRLSFTKQYADVGDHETNRPDSG